MLGPLTGEVPAAHTRTLITFKGSRRGTVTSVRPLGRPILTPDPVAKWNAKKAYSESDSIA